MKLKSHITFLVTIMLSLAVMSSCTTTREQEVEDELAEFRTWVSRTTSNIANATEEDWKQAKQDFSMRTQELDQKQDNFTDEVKAEYKDLKQRFNDSDEQFQQQQSQARITEWQRKLLGQWADMSTITEANVREAYITYMENVRALKQNWTNTDWEMAKLIMQQLNERREQLTGDIDTDSQIKIKALQMEFRTLETAADVSN